MEYHKMIEQILNEINVLLVKNVEKKKKNNWFLVVHICISELGYQWFQ